MSATKDDQNPCISCGACCAYFRIYFYWREAEFESDIQVPQHLTTDVSSFQRCMLGTTEKSGNRCIALKGRVGHTVGCSIYPNRPSPCRAFPASYIDGKANKRCAEARQAHGLKPLTPQDWLPEMPQKPPLPEQEACNPRSPDQAPQHEQN